MSISTGTSKLKEGFKPAFWVANGMELFERLAYYGQQIVFMIYMRDNLGFSEFEAGKLSSIFGGLIYLLPIFAGTLADKWGFKKAFNVAFSILGLGYFLIGSVGMSTFAPLYGDFSQYWLLMIFIVLTAFGGSFIKPSVLGTVASTTTKETKSLGFAIYYWLVNAGAMIGPTIAYFVRDSYGNQYVYIVSSISCFAMLVVNILLFKEVKSETEEVVESLTKKIENLFVVLANFKFMIFLLIYSLYWIIFWQEFIIVPYYITDFISASAPYEIIQSWSGAGAIILLQIPLNRLTKKLETSKAILVGFAFSSLIWIIIGISPSIPTIAVGIVAFAIGEMIQAPRYYEYISEIAPIGQQGLFQGYAFLPIAIARFVGDPFGGWLYQISKENNTPENIWIALSAIGILATILMYFYNKSQGLFDKLEEMNNSRYKDVPAELGFNWGAFLITPIWLLFHKKFIAGTLIFLTYLILFYFSFQILSLSIGFILLTISAYYGATANKIAWQRNNYSSIEELISRQKIWTIVGLVLFVLSICLLILV